MKNVKIYKKSVPYILAGTITLCGFASFHHTPFITDVNSYSLDLITNIDENGKITKEYRKDIDMDDATIEYYSKWKETENGYERNIDYYMPEDYTVEEIQEIVKNNEKFTPSLRTTETKSFITDEEKEKNEGYLKAVIIEKDAKEVIIRETELQNEATTTMAIGMFFLLSYGLNRIGSKKRKRIK